MENSGKLKTINELDPSQNRIERENIAAFLSDFDHTYMDKSRPKGPDYLIIDNLVETFADLEKADLTSARREVEKIVEHFCNSNS